LSSHVSHDRSDGHTSSSPGQSIGHTNCL
jgi:hypothetical protein